MTKEEVLNIITSEIKKTKEDLSVSDSFGQICHNRAKIDTLTEVICFIKAIEPNTESDFAFLELEELAEQSNPYPFYDKSDMCVAHSHDGFNEGFQAGYRLALKQ